MAKPVSSDLDFGNASRIVNLPDATSAQHPATKAQLDLKAPKDSPTFTTSVTLPGDPASALQAATKQYVDNVAAGLDIKGSARAATTGALPTNTYSAGVLTASSNGALAAQDGVTLVLNDRLLVKNEATAANNGIYFVSQVGDASHPYKLTRSTDMDAWSEVPGATLWIEEGSTLADTGWVCTSNAGGTIGSTSIAWTQWGGTGAFQAASANLTSWAGVTRASGFDTFVATPSSANLRALLTDETGTGAAVFAGGALGSATATTQTQGDNSTKVATTAYVDGQTETWTRIGSGTSGVQALGGTFKRLKIVFKYTSSSACNVQVSSDGGSTYGSNMTLGATASAGNSLSGGSAELLNTGIVASKFLASAFMASSGTNGQNVGGTEDQTESTVTGVTTHIKFNTTSAYTVWGLS